MDIKKKLRYEPPVALDLSAKSRSVTGDDAINGCFSGGSAGGDQEQCAAGTGGGVYAVCSTGNRPGAGDCVSGNRPFYCEAGGWGSSDPDGCRTGMYV